MFRAFFRVKNIVLIFASSFLLVSGLWFQNKIYSQSERYYGQKVTRIDFEGNVNVKTSELINIIQLRPGMILNRDVMNSDLKSLFQQGSIANARVEGSVYKDGVSLVFIIEERPVVTSITFRGLKELSESILTDLIPVKVDKVFSEKALLRSIDLIQMQAKDKGLFATTVKYEKISDGKKSNSIEVIFTVDEGEEIKVGKINIIGVKSVDVQDVYSSLKLEEEGLFAKGEFKPHLFEKDKQQIISALNQQGYLDARLVNAKKEIKWNNPVKKDKRVLVITFEIDEGERSFFNGYSVEWDDKYLNQDTKKPIYSKTELEKYFEQSDAYIGSYFNDQKYTRDRGIINYLYNEKGYIYARGIPEKTVIRLNKDEIDRLSKAAIQMENEKKGIDYYNIKILRKIYETEPEKRNLQFIHTNFVIQEGIKGYIEHIIIKGNEKTADEVIRREFLVKEGDLFNASLVQRSREKIYNLGYFSEVNLDARPGSKEGYMNLVVSVAEQLTGSMSVGGGYGTLSGFSIFLQLAEKNLNGTGQTISGKLEFGLMRSSIDLSWTEPWLFGKPWGLTLGGQFMHTQLITSSINPLSTQYAAVNTTGTTNSTASTYQNSTTEQAYYFQDKIGLITEISHKLGINWMHYHGLNPSISKISNPSSKVDDIVFLEASLGWQFQNKLVNGISYDNRDNIFNTTSGVSVRLNADFVGGVLGGFDHYNRYGLSTSFYWWPTDFTFFNLIRVGELRRWRFVFEHHISATYTQQTNPVWGKQDMYSNPYIEAYDKLYLGGFEGVRGYAPFDTSFLPFWNQNGGAGHRLLLDTELRIPIEPSLIWAVLFFDMGALFNDLNQYYTDQTTPQSQIDAIKATELTSQNVFNLAYYRYSWGFGFRLQIPVMPIRLYFAQRLFWNSSRGFYNDPNQKNLEVVFAIGDYRF
ncbi:MAG: BamA/TamA family outer membrane protein [Spirochaetia bacterium]|nr:BamA/TamA family outer membrane protein [Spirochaetia bacterium]